MRKFVGTLMMVGVALVCSTTEAKPKRKIVPAGSAAPASPSASAQAPSAPASAPEGEWSIGDTKYWANLQEEMDGQIKRTNAACGTTIVGKFDKESFRGQLTEGGSFGLSGYARSMCAAGPSAIEDMCLTVNGDEATAKKVRDVVKAKLTTIECRWGGKGKQAIGFANKKLVTTIEIGGEDNGASYTTKVGDFMKQKM
ncbi:MAG: hypothetical protein JWO86_5850 [Myxococcaceae bacterium]|nr:hypothetical protein [Myxococcaceae bacterium]MEA2748595.1 hypothetical protein [Myxococcales bacterium]